MEKFNKILLTSNEENNKYKLLNENNTLHKNILILIYYREQIKKQANQLSQNKNHMSNDEYSKLAGGLTRRMIAYKKLIKELISDQMYELSIYSNNRIKLLHPITPVTYGILNNDYKVRIIRVLNYDKLNCELYLNNESTIMVDIKSSLLKELC